MMREKIGAVVLAAGKGSRMKSQVHKQYLELLGHPLAVYCIAALEEKVDEIVLVASPGEEEYCRQTLVEPYGFQKVKAIVPGGKERYHSVYAGLQELSDCTHVLIQDSARPCLTDSIIEICIAGAREYGACVAAMPSKDTIKRVSEEGYAVETPDRRSLWIIQTPQAFSYPIVFGAYSRMMQEDDGSLPVTDDAMVVEHWSENRVYMVEGAYENIKVTTPEDLDVAALYLKKQGFSRLLEVSEKRTKKCEKVVDSRDEVC